MGTDTYGIFHAGFRKNQTSTDEQQIENERGSPEVLRASKLHRTALQLKIPYCTDIKAAF